jgi:hypothetical protein
MIGWRCEENMFCNGSYYKEGIHWGDKGTNMEICVDKDLAEFG